MKSLIYLLAVCVTTQAFKVDNGFNQIRNIDWNDIKPDNINLDLMGDSTYIGESRIVNGQGATPHQFPYQVAIFTKKLSGSYFCGGSLISSNYVMTAAHCTVSVYSYEIVLGAHNIRKAENTQVVLKTKKVTVHPKFQMTSNKIVYDIALLQLPQTVSLNNYIQTIRLPSRSQATNDFNKQLATVSGWGKISDNAQGISDTLNYVSDRIITNTECANGFEHAVETGETVICLNGNGKKSSCNGDSGGPLTISDSDGKPTQVGIVSFGLSAGCAKGYPSAYSRVTQFLDWIENNSDVQIRN